jgi:hypothetical protein
MRPERASSVPANVSLPHFVQTVRQIDGFPAFPIVCLNLSASILYLSCSPCNIRMAAAVTDSGLRPPDLAGNGGPDVLGLGEVGSWKTQYSTTLFVDAPVAHRFRRFLVL